jgi:hypothetical protein
MDKCRALKVTGNTASEEKLAALWNLLLREVLLQGEVYICISIIIFKTILASVIAYTKMSNP